MDPEGKPAHDEACHERDFDPAILARNVILLTLVADNQTSPAIIWNIFFHMRLDTASLDALTTQCRKLIDMASTLKQWRSSAYSHFLRMCTEYTLIEIRRHWTLYAAMHDLPQLRMNSIETDFSERSEYAKGQIPTSMMSSARSAGPLFLRALHVSGDQFQKYWEAGGCFSSTTEARNSRLLNPTFVYSLGGEGCSVHYGTNPLMSFHLASSLRNCKDDPTVADIVTGAKAEFEMWCTSFRTAVSNSSHNHTSPLIRLFLGEATAVCHSLRTYATTGSLTSNITVAQWDSHFVALDQREYLANGAPTTFDIIDTSNLDDHIGCLNVIIAAVPLLPTRRRFALYTESLLFYDQDATKEFTEYLKTDLSTFGLLVGVCPVDYLSGFSSRSNVHELIMHKSMGQEAGQFHRITTWKSPSSGNDFGARDGEKPRLPIFDPHQLGTRLYDMYQQLFEKEEPIYLAQRITENPAITPRLLATSNLINDTRETFVLFLKLVKERLEIPEARWSETMERFYSILQQNNELLDTLHRYDLYTYSYFHGVHTLSSVFGVNVPKVGPMANWDQMSSLVRIILVVPRSNLAMLQKVSQDVPTPCLQCELKGTGRGTHDIFTSLQAAFGTVISTGTPGRPSVLFEQDPEGRAGTSPLVVSFIVAAGLLTVDASDKIDICFAMRSTAGASMKLNNKLGSEFYIFRANLMDKFHVMVVPEKPSPITTKPTPHVGGTNTAIGVPQIGAAGSVMVEMDDECELVTSLICRVFVERQEAKKLFGAGSKLKPGISQRSACVMQLSVGKYVQDIAFPFPIIGSKNRLGLARKSFYIEITLPISGPFRSDGMKLNFFPVHGENLALTTWNLHNLNLSRLPVLETRTHGLEKWLKTHLAWMLSARERKLTKTHENDALALVKDTIHTILRHASGTGGGPLRKVFALRDKPSTECDTIIFVSDVKFDLAAHTIVCDAYVLPLTPALMSRIGLEFGSLVQKGDICNVGVYGDEMKVWKQILPALAERCRSWAHTSKCEYATLGTIPLSVDMHFDPLCGCGRGKNAEGMMKVELWRKFAPLVTRIALSPLFALSYLEPILRDPEAGRCAVCRGKGKPKMQKCAACKNVRYCSRQCQKNNWEAHKSKCKPPV
ncbi:hypothetical protein C8R43DRAFT_978486 [Mycena crocata]|nr:hypothetical protein C8R43DRAFT_978486 [Mycena crocata]